MKTISKPKTYLHTCLVLMSKCYQNAKQTVLYSVSLSVYFFEVTYFVTLLLFVDFGLLLLVICLCLVELLSGPLLICSSVFLRFTVLLTAATLSATSCTGTTCFLLRGALADAGSCFRLQLTLFFLDPIASNCSLAVLHFF